MKKRTVLLFIFIILISGFANANPLTSNFQNPVWMEFSIGLAFDLQDKDFDIDLMNLEMNVYFEGYSGFGLGLTTTDVWGFYVSGLHLFDFFNSDYLLFPLKLKAGYYNAYGEWFPGFTLSTGVKGVVEILPEGEGESRSYFITDLLGSISYYTISLRNNSTFQFFAELYPGFILEASDE